MKKRTAVGVYNEKSVEILEEPQAIRKSAGMYLGSTGDMGLFQIIKEIIDNSTDEALAGFNNLIDIYIEDNWITVADQGRGVPVGIAEKTGRSTLIEVFARLHAGGKKSSAYSKGSTGTHGQGSALTNFMSSSFIAYSFRQEKGGWHKVEFKQGEFVKFGKSVPPKIAGKSAKRGTVVRFQPEYSCFNKNSKIPIDKIRELIDIRAYLVPTCKFRLTTSKGTVEYYHKGGLKDYLAILVKEVKSEPVGKPIIIHTDTVDVAIQWSSHIEEQLLAYVNSSRTVDGGTHVNGLYTALTKAIEPYKGKKDFTPTDLRTGLIGVINISLQGASFDSQIKSRLVTETATAQVHDATYNALVQAFKSNRSLVNGIIRRAAEIKKLRIGFNASKKATADLRSAKTRSLMPAKLSDCQSRDQRKTELYIVEGDSAKGLGTNARNNEYQAILPIRGKIMNAFGAKKNEAKLLASEAVRSILVALGYDGRDPYNSKKLRYGKIIILADPDPDGRHIALLLTNLFMRIMPNVINDGMVFACDTPLFMYSATNEKYFANTRKELEKIVPGKFNSQKVTRFKGLGEIPDWRVMRPIIFDTKTRKLTKILPLAEKDTLKYHEIVGDNAAGRRALLGL